MSKPDIMSQPKHDSCIKSHLCSSFVQTLSKSSTSISPPLVGPASRLWRWRRDEHPAWGNPEPRRVAAFLSNISVRKPSRGPTPFRRPNDFCSLEYTMIDGTWLLSPLRGVGYVHCRKFCWLRCTSQHSNSMVNINPPSIRSLRMLEGQS